jgi:hypothetical protein
MARYRGSESASASLLRVYGLVLMRQTILSFCLRVPHGRQSYRREGQRHFMIASKCSPFATTIVYQERNVQNWYDHTPTASFQMKRKSRQCAAMQGDGISSQAFAFDSPLHNARAGRTISWGAND